MRDASTWIAEHLAAEDGPLDPGDLVKCERLGTTLTADACARRATAITPSGRGRGFPLFAESCYGCAQGETVRERMPEDYRPRAFRVDPRRLKRQRVAMANAARVGLLECVPTIDAPASVEGWGAVRSLGGDG